MPPFRPALPVAPDFSHFRATLSNLPASKIATAPSTISCYMQFFCCGKHESITQKRQNNYPTMLDMLTRKRLSLACQEGNDDQLGLINLMRVGQPTPSETFPNSNAARQEDQEADNPLTMLKSPGPPSFQ